MVFYNKSGVAVAYLYNDGVDIYLFDGTPVAYLHEDAVYDFDGNHLGWFDKGWIRDIQGDCVFFTKDATGGPLKPWTQLAPLKGLRQLKSLKSLRNMPTMRAPDSLSWSKQSDTNFFKS